MIKRLAIATLLAGFLSACSTVKHDPTTGQEIERREPVIWNLKGNFDFNFTPSAMTQPSPVEVSPSTTLDCSKESGFTYNPTEQLPVDFQEWGKEVQIETGKIQTFEFDIKAGESISVSVAKTLKDSCSPAIAIVETKGNTILAEAENSVSYGRFNTDQTVQVQVVSRTSDTYAVLIKRS